MAHFDQKCTNEHCRSSNQQIVNAAFSCCVSGTVVVDDWCLVEFVFVSSCLISDFVVIGSVRLHTPLRKPMTILSTHSNTTGPFVEFFFESGNFIWKSIDVVAGTHLLLTIFRDFERGSIGSLFCFSFFCDLKKIAPGSVGQVDKGRSALQLCHSMSRFYSWRWWEYSGVFARFIAQ